MADCSFPLSINLYMYMSYGLIILLCIAGALIVSSICGIDSLVTWLVVSTVFPIVFYPLVSKLHGERIEFHLPYSTDQANRELLTELNQLSLGYPDVMHDPYLYFEKSGKNYCFKLDRFGGFSLLPELVNKMEIGVDLDGPTTKALNIKILTFGGKDKRDYDPTAIVDEINTLISNITERVPDQIAKLHVMQTQQNMVHDKHNHEWEALEAE